MSPLQQGMLFHHLVTPKAGVDIEQMVITLSGELAVPEFERAWQRWVGRHEVSRKPSPGYRTSPPASLPLPSYN
jgi:hypothetical protein